MQRVDLPDLPDNLVYLQAAWYRTYDALAARRPARTTVLRRRLCALSVRLRWHPYWTRTAAVPAARAELRRQARQLRTPGECPMNRRPEHFTLREEQVLSQIRRSILDRGEALSVRELGAALGLRSPASVVYHLQNLARSGALVRDGRNWNTCRLTC